MNRAVAESKSPRQRMTVAQWADLDEDVEGELVDGFLEEEEAATFLHEIIVGWLLGVLGPWAMARGGFAVGSEAKIAIGPWRGRKPDVSVFLGPSRPDIEASLSRIAPHVAVEVVSERPRDARRDRVDKLRDYAALGVAFYWLLDPKLRTLEVLALGPRRRYVHALDVAGGRIAKVPGCDGLVLDLDRMWAEIDAAGAPRRHGPASRKRR